MGDKVLIIGGGGREHALAWKISQSKHVGQIYVAPGNGGTSRVEKTANIPASEMDPNCHEMVVKFCSEKTIDLVIIGPEAPLANGLSDSLDEAGIPCFGPSKSAAQIESSKAFSKDFMQRHNIPTAQWQSFTDADSACQYIKTADFPALVVKASGLAAGKGVIVAETVEEAQKAVREILEDKIFGDAGSTVVVEEKLDGEEVSLLCFSDGERVAPMPPSQDHKRIFYGDKGPNTGGMGAYAPCPQVDNTLYESLVKEVLQKTVDGLKEDGCRYIGVLYAGLMLTSNGPKVLEFNCRFGDPETQSLLPLMKSDLYATMMECVGGDISTSLPVWHKDTAAVGVVMASGGYPGPYQKGDPITGLEELEGREDILVFHAGTKSSESEDGTGALVTSGGRVLVVVGLDGTVEKAKEKAYEGIGKISFNGAQYRKDIAYRACKRKPLTYASAGVSISSGDSLVEAIKPLAAATVRAGCQGGLGGFGGVFNLKDSGYKDPLLVSGTDGVGTKLKIAQACGRHSTVGIDLVAMCVNDVLAHGAEPLFFLDYFACGKLDVGIAQETVSGVAKGCSMAGCALLGGETAEMPGMYKAGEYDIAGFTVGAVEHDQVLPRKENIQPGDCVIGLASSGLHSNGFSLVRRIIEDSDLDYDSPCPFPVVSGFQAMLTLGQALLEPTKIYSKSVLPVLRQGLVKAFAHITGGGLVENIPRVLPDGTGVVLNATQWEVPPVFGWISSLGNVELHEMTRTFNCGVGAVLIASKDHTTEILKDLSAAGEKASVIGDVVDLKEGAQKVVIHHLSEFLEQGASKCLLPDEIVGGTVQNSIKRLKVCNGQDHKTRRKVGVLISGSGTNLQALINQTLHHDSSAEIVLVVSNKDGVLGLERACKAGIPTKVINHKAYKSRLEFDRAVSSVLEEAGVELVCLAGFMRILTGEFVNKWHGKLINTHPSLLPAFKGAHAHKLALEAGVKVSGCTVHFVEEEVDSGAIIVQEPVPVFKDDTEETLQERVKAVEHIAYPKAMELLASGTIQLGEDGKLKWNKTS